jgi:hypothetical protein
MLAHGPHPARKSNRSPPSVATAPAGEETALSREHRAPFLASPLSFPWSRSQQLKPKPCEAAQVAESVVRLTPSKAPARFSLLKKLSRMDGGRGELGRLPSDLPSRSFRRLLQVSDLSFRFRRGKARLQPYWRWSRANRQLVSFLKPPFLSSQVCTSGVFFVHRIVVNFNAC